MLRKSNNTKMFLSSKIVLFIFFCALSVFLVSCDNENTIQFSNTQADSQELQKEKLLLEIEGLKRDLKFYEYNKWIGFFSGILGVIAIIWTITRGISTLQYQAKTQKVTRVSELLSTLHHADSEIRIGAATSLTQYADDVVPEVITALRIEKNIHVREVLESILIRVDTKNVSQIIKANSGTLPERSFLLGRLYEAGAKWEYTNALMRFSQRSSKSIIRYFSSQFDLGRDFQKAQNQRSLVLAEKIDELNQELLNLSKQSTLLAESTGKVIALWLRSGRKPKRLNTILDLNLTNLYGADISRVSLNRSLICKCLLRHANLSNSELVMCEISESNLLDALLDSTNLSKSNLSNSILREGKGNRANFSEAIMDNVVFSKGIFVNSVFDGATARNAKFKGTKLCDSSFISCDLEAAEFHGADMVGCNLNMARCYRAKFISANLASSSLVEIELSGTDLREANFEGANMQNANLSGANIKGANFRRANISGLILNKAKNVESAYFD